jgi:uncharacterized membrane protein YfcA
MDPNLGFNPFTFLFLGGTFLAALVASTSGFAFGIVAAAIWLYILNPLQTATLIIVLGFVVQGYAVWKLRHALNWRRLAPLLAGAALGVPIGVFTVSYINEHAVKIGVGIVLILFSLHALIGLAVKPIKSDAVAGDVTAGFLNGILGGATGLAGIVAIIWCQLRGWTKDQQRAVFQPVGVATFIMSAIWLGGRGAISSDVIWLAVFALPVLLAGTWIGMKLYGRLSETQFRKVILALLLISGVALILA